MLRYRWRGHDFSTHAHEEAWDGEMPTQTLKITLKDLFVLFIHVILNTSISVKTEAQRSLWTGYNATVAAGYWLQRVAEPDYFLLPPSYSPSIPC